MGLAKDEAELATRAARFLKAELKRADVTYEELATRLKAHGLNETRDSIAAKLKPDYMLNPNVSAEVITRRPFYVIGEVQKPGSYPYVSDMTAVNAIAMAGGFTRRARKNDFYIRRLDKDGKVVRIEANVGTVLQAGDTLEVRERLF